MFWWTESRTAMFVFLILLCTLSLSDLTAVTPSLVLLRQQAGSVCTLWRWRAAFHTEVFEGRLWFAQTFIKMWSDFRRFVGDVIWEGLSLKHHLNIIWLLFIMTLVNEATGSFLANNILAETNWESEYFRKFCFLFFWVRNVRGDSTRLSGFCRALLNYIWWLDKTVCGAPASDSIVRSSPPWLLRLSVAHNQSPSQQTNRWCSLFRFFLWANYCRQKNILYGTSWLNGLSLTCDTAARGHREKPALLPGCRMDGRQSRNDSEENWDIDGCSDWLCQGLLPVSESAATLWRKLSPAGDPRFYFDCDFYNCYHYACRERREISPQTHSICTVV